MLSLLILGAITNGFHQLFRVLKQQYLFSFFYNLFTKTIKLYVPAATFPKQNFTLVAPPKQGRIFTFLPPESVKQYRLPDVLTDDHCFNQKGFKILLLDIILLSAAVRIISLECGRPAAHSARDSCRCCARCAIRQPSLPIASTAITPRYLHHVRPPPFSSVNSMVLI